MSPVPGSDSSPDSVAGAGRGVRYGGSDCTSDCAELKETLPCGSSAEMEGGALDGAGSGGASSGTGSGVGSDAEGAGVTGVRAFSVRI